MQAVRQAGAPVCHIKEAILLWRGTLKDFILRYSSNLPPPADRVSWDQPALAFSFAQIPDKCSISVIGPGGAPLGLSLGVSGLALEMALGLEQPPW